MQLNWALIHACARSVTLNGMHWPVESFLASFRVERDSSAAVAAEGAAQASMEAVPMRYAAQKVIIGYLWRAVMLF